MIYQVWAVLVVILTICHAQLIGPFHYFKTRAHFRASILNVTVNPATKDQSPGYIFVTPHVPNYRVGVFGPQIFDQDGTLIWYGNDSVHVRAMNAQVCDWRGERGNHICFNDGPPVEQFAHSVGKNRFLDSSYEPVAEDFGAFAGLRGPDAHELNTPSFGDGETFIQDVYDVKYLNLTAYKGPEDGKVLDGCFQEISQKERKVLFQWCAMDHVNVWDTAMFLSNNRINFSLPIGGNGTINSPWDFFHINSIDRNQEGDYLVSSRHFNAIYKIAGRNNVHGVEDGSILWQLNGVRNNFTMIDDVNFSRQHHARFISTSHSKTVISLFDNAYDGFAYTASMSAGKIITLDNATMEARPVRTFNAPDGKRSYSQGSMQLLSNGNVFIGWGNRPRCSEHHADTRLLWYATITGGIESQRCTKQPWVGRPKTLPIVLPYARSFKPEDNSPLIAYVSWNGATEVKAWTFYTAYQGRHGPWWHAGTYIKSGFETSVNLTKYTQRGFAPYVRVDALDADGKVLARSKATETFVPTYDLCLAKGCNDIEAGWRWFDYDRIHSIGYMAPRSRGAAVWVACALLIVLELVIWAMQLVGIEALLRWSSRSGRRKLLAFKRRRLFVPVWLAAPVAAPMMERKWSVPWSDASSSTTLLGKEWPPEVVVSSPAEEKSE